MKKKKIMRTAVVLLVIALLTVWGLSGIYAKYATSGTQDDTGRVAKWGVVLQANSDESFSGTYAKEDANYTLGDNSVVASGQDKVLAPGTSGSFKGVSVKGVPEVAVKITNSGTVTLAGWSIDGAYYCPLKVTVGAKSLYGLDYESSDAFAAAINSEIADSSSYQKPGTDLSKVTGITPAISWEWAFEGADGTKVERTDAKDTALGNLATAPTINIKVKTTVTQVN